MVHVVPATAIDGVDITVYFIIKNQRHIYKYSLYIYIKSLRISLFIKWNKCQKIRVGCSSVSARPFYIGSSTIDWAIRTWTRNRNRHPSPTPHPPPLHYPTRLIYYVYLYIRISPRWFTTLTLINITKCFMSLSNGARAPQSSKEVNFKFPVLSLWQCFKPNKILI